MVLLHLYFVCPEKQVKVKNQDGNLYTESLQVFKKISWVFTLMPEYNLLICWYILSLLLGIFRLLQ